MRGGAEVVVAPAGGELPAWLVINRDRLARWATWCAAGHCRYARLPAHEEHPVHSGDTCPGYAGTVHAESDGPVLRMRWCPHRIAWGERRRTLLRTHRATRRLGREED